MDELLKAVGHHGVVPEPDRLSLSALDAGGLQAQLFELLDEMMKGLDADQEDALIADLPDPLRVWLLNWMSFEVMLGSLLGYFYNSHGRHARLAVEALREIGATDMASVLERASKTMDLHRAAWTANRAAIDRTAELYAVVRPYEELPNADELSDLTEEYWAAADHDDWGDPPRRLPPTLRNGASTGRSEERVGQSFVAAADPSGAKSEAWA